METEERNAVGSTLLSHAAEGSSWALRLNFVDFVYWRAGFWRDFDKFGIAAFGTGM
jgi:hypothetical protein